MHKTMTKISTLRISLVVIITNSVNSH